MTDINATTKRMLDDETLFRYQRAKKEVERIEKGLAALRIDAVRHKNSADIHTMIARLEDEYSRSRENFSVLVREIEAKHGQS